MEHDHSFCCLAWRLLARLERSDKGQRTAGAAGPTGTLHSSQGGSRLDESLSPASHESSPQPPLLQIPCVLVWHAGNW